MHRSDGSIKAVGRANSRDISRTGRRRRSLADVDCHNQVGSTAVLVNQCASNSSLVYASINDG